MPPFKLTPAQHDKVMNDPVHYRLGSKRYIEKENCFECEASPSDLMIIKKIVDEPIAKVQESGTAEMTRPERADNEDSQGAGFVEK